MPPGNVDIITSSSSLEHRSLPGVWCKGSDSISPRNSHHGPVTLRPTGQNQSWILFGVQGARRTLTPAQISVNDQNTDESVFHGLRKCYQTHRGRLRLWFSIWQLGRYEDFNRLTLERMVREYSDLPTHQDYQYSPRAGAADAMNSLLYTCRFPCACLIPHDCMLPPTGVRNLKRIPKRRGCFESDQTSPVWGLEAVFAVSSSHLLIYHCIMVA